ncbi:MAG TPA: hypothetical protein VHR97_02750 [Candidatus Baltobacteraceae bacterium]|jgi:hypothetical protein|nr:hypothetical protein [Candidatus Baltobacteraceae bacterium]
MLASLILAAATASAPFPAAGTYRYSATLNGQPAGHWTLNVKAGSDGTEIDEDSVAIFMGVQMTAKAALVLGPDFSPVKYEGHYSAAGLNPIVSVAATPNGVTVTSSQAPPAKNLALVPNTRHLVIIDPGLAAGLFALPAQLAAWREDSVTWVTPISAEAASLATQSNAPSAPPGGVPPNDVAISMVGTSSSGRIPVTIWYDPSTMVPDQIVVPSQNAILTRERS